jgi:hypothetical protein
LPQTTIVEARQLHSALAQVSKPVHERYLTYFGKLRQSFDSSFSAMSPSSIFKLSLLPSGHCVNDELLVRPV